MNKNARAGFILALIGVFGALFVPFLWLALVAATVFGIIALFQIPKRHERGMFFAIFAAASLVLFFLLVVVLMNATGLGED